MPYDYKAVTGPINLENDSEAVRNHKAAYGALEYALRNAGWRPEQITNGLHTYFDSVSAVLAEELRNIDTSLDGGIIDLDTASRLADHITPLPVADHCQCFRCPKCPCRPDYCNACVPEEN